MTTVEEHIRAFAAQPFVRAKTDCTGMCDRWVWINRGVSPVELGGIVYHDDESAMAIVSRIAPLMNRGMRRAGLKVTANPKKGDVGLVIFNGQMGPAIHAGTHWITRHVDGFLAARSGS